MKKLSEFLIKRNRIILGVFILLAVICVLLIPKVNVIYDMTKYLPENSAMKQGLETLEEQFPDVSMTDSTIRLMFTGLTQDEKESMQEELESIEYVDEVAYDIDDEDYNNGVYTLYELAIPYEDGSDELASVTDEVKTRYVESEDYTAQFDSTAMEIPIGSMLVAVLVMIAILFVMCQSWVEPILFIITIGVAVLLNMGTNAFLSGVSNTTHSIAAVLQLVLSMDYSIILMNRYRQELTITPNKKDAMRKAIQNGFSSITSSAITTIVGMLVLVFMSFKIGQDMGIVLAKGVFISMICIFTVLPGLILMFHNLIFKTGKKVPQPPMKPFAGFSFNAKHVVLVAFAVLFVLAFMLKGNTAITFLNESPSEIDEIFPDTNDIVMVYENDQDDKATDMLTALGDDENVDSVQSYSISIGKQYTAAELADELADMDDVDMGTELDEDTMKMMYYYHFTGGEVGNIPAANLMNFIVDDVMNNDTFADEMDDSVKDNEEQIRKFANKEALLEEKTALEMADFFEMDKEQAEQLYLFYYIEHGGINTGKLSIRDFADFIVNDVAKDPDYSSEFSAENIKQMKQLLTYTDKAKVTKKRTYSDLAGMLEMDKSQAKLLYVSYFASQDTSLSKMTFHDLVQFLNTDVVNDETLSSNMDKSAKSQLASLKHYANKSAISKKKSAAKLAKAFSMDEETVTQLFMLKVMSSATTQMTQQEMYMEAAKMKMSEYEFVNFILTDVASNENYAAMFDASALESLGQLQSMMNLTVSGTKLSYKDAAALMSMDASDMKMLYAYHDMGSKKNTWKLSMQQVVNYILNHQADFSGSMSKSELKQMKTLKKIMDASVDGKTFTASEMSDMIGVGNDEAKMLYTLYLYENDKADSWTLSPYGFITFLNDEVLTNDDYADEIDKEDAKDLKSGAKMVKAVVSGKAYSCKEMAKLMSGMSDDMDEEQLELLYMYYFSQEAYDDSWTMSFEDFIHCMSDEVMEDDRFDDVIDSSNKEELDDAKETIEDAVESLVGKDYNLAMISTTLDAESEETFAYLDKLHDSFDEELGEDSYYLIGNTEMAYEMNQTFSLELNKITLLTAIAIFIVVLITFRNAAVPVILVLLIQTAVYVMQSSMGLRDMSINYLALLIVQSILMGATIDYGILFTNYYRENRRTKSIKQSLYGAYSGAIHTIMTSGLIMILVTFIMSFAFSDPTIGQICQTISLGTLTAVILILFILPGTLAVFDKLVCGKNRASKTE
ncbi:MMPL family transporter [Eubacterium oxidoreducens]|uniref:MMPL family protein n=1 Tax=Eubacterium oxidoreducens TaxID=1732 RepID=A0A1G6AV97_EUBOX|nr:MMPL family transporter [Eubacterium oxidoreducens]SDB12284.1 MMPL family protein [Eubacterium oxidoreducens]